MKNRIPLFFLALAVAAPSSLQAATLVWDTSNAPGFQNGNGTWGTDNFWTTTTGGGTTLSGWTSGDEPWLGGNAQVGQAATPGGDFTITVSGTQTASTVRQIQNGDGNFTLTGGSLEVLGFRVDRGTMTVNSVILEAVPNANNWMALTAITGTSTLILGGNNTFTNIARIGGNSGSGGTVLLNHPNALGLGTEVLFGNGSSLDLNGYSISGKTIRITQSRTGFLRNTSATDVEWSGNVVLDNPEANVGFRAGGTAGEVEVSGVISGISGNTVQSLDNGTLRLSGPNTYAGDTSVRPGSTMIVGNTSALGSTVGVTFINTGATLDLNGFNVGNEAVTLQTTTSSLLNNSTSAAATVGGNILISQSTSTIGGPGDLSLGGVISSTTTGGFSKTGTGSLTLSGNNTYTGATSVDAGALLVNGDQSAATGAVTVASIATLGGTGTIGGATTISGVLAPGNSIGTLTVANDVTWNGGQSWLFDLGVAGASIGSPGTSDLLSITGNNDFLKGTGSSWTFDFAGTGEQGWYRLADWTGGTTTFSAGDFTATNLAGGNTGEFTVQNDALYMQVVPEPATWSLAAAGLAGAAWSLTRRRRSV